MKLLIKTTLAFLLIWGSTAFGANRYQIYVGNGILTDAAGAIENMVATRRLVGTTYNSKELRWNIAFNPSTLFGIGDFYESIEAFIRDQTGTSFTWADVFKGHIVGTALSSTNWFRDNFPSETLRTVLDSHVDQYKSDIDSGDVVLIVPHSQGNWYALEAYDRVLSELSTTPDITKRITAFHVASPASRMAGLDDAPNQGLDRYLDRYLTNDVDGIVLVPRSLLANATIEYKADSITPHSDRWWDISWLQALFPRSALVIGDIAALNAHYYLPTYASPQLTLSDKLKAGINASLDRLVFADNPIIVANTPRSMQPIINKYIIDRQRETEYQILNLSEYPLNSVLSIQIPSIEYYTTDLYSVDRIYVEVDGQTVKSFDVSHSIDTNVVEVENLSQRGAVVLKTSVRGGEDLLFCENGFFQNDDVFGSINSNLIPSTAYPSNIGKTYRLLVSFSDSGGHELTTDFSRDSSNGFSHTLTYPIARSFSACLRNGGIVPQTKSYPEGSINNFIGSVDISVGKNEDEGIYITENYFRSIDSSSSSGSLRRTRRVNLCSGIMTYDYDLRTTAVTGGTTLIELGTHDGSNIVGGISTSEVDSEYCFLENFSINY